MKVSLRQRTSMTYRLLIHLTAALLALHTMLGCCWHHAHACGAACPAAADTHDDSDCNASGPAATHGHHGPHPCQGAACVFMRSADRVAFEPAGGGAHPLPSCLASDGGLTAGAACVESPFAVDALLPPLRLHLAHCVLRL
jgi:hypothetical protein